MSNSNGRAGNGERRAQAEQALQTLEREVELVSPRLAGWWGKYLRSSASRYFDILDFFRPEDAGARILEVGSVPGQFTILLKRLGYDVRGVDIDPSRVGELWEKYGLVVDRVDIELEPLPFEDGAFDLVLFTEVLEHLRVNPLHALREVHRVLRPGGRVILSTNHITPVHRLEFLRTGRSPGNALAAFQKLEQLGHMGHFRIYNAQEVREFCDYVGLRVAEQVNRGELVIGRRAGVVLSRLPESVKKHFRHSVYLVARK